MHDFDIDEQANANLIYEIQLLEIFCKFDGVVLKGTGAVLILSKFHKDVRRILSSTALGLVLHFTFTTNVGMETEQ